ATCPETDAQETECCREDVKPWCMDSHPLPPHHLMPHEGSVRNARVNMEIRIRSGAPGATISDCYPVRAPMADGGTPVQRRKAREKLLASAKPSVKAVSVTDQPSAR